MVDVRQFVRSSAYALLANAASLAVSSILVFVLPKILGIEDFGYWQLYVFYTSYVGLLHLGWVDGIYLKLGGQRWSDLDFRTLKAQTLILLFSQILVTAVFTGLTLALATSTEQKLVFSAVAACVVLVNVRLLFSYVLQCTYRIKEYSTVLLLERILLIGTILAAVLVGFESLWLFLALDLACKAVSLAVAVRYCADIMRVKASWGDATVGAAALVRSGSALMFSNLAGMLGIGLIRFTVERGWGVTDFGRVSLMLSLCYLVMGFASTMGLVLFPVLRRMDRRTLVRSYALLRPLLDTVLIVLMLAYFVLAPVVRAWLPAYADSLHFLLLLFPIIAFDGTTSVLLVTYLKSLRKERALFVVNLLCLAVAAVLAVIAVRLSSLDFAVLSMVLVAAARSLGTSVVLSRELGRGWVSDWGPQAAAITIFLIAGRQVPEVAPLIVAAVALAAVFLRRSALGGGAALVRNSLGPSG